MNLLAFLMDAFLDTICPCIEGMRHVLHVCPLASSVGLCYGQELPNGTTSREPVQESYGLVSVTRLEPPLPCFEAFLLRLQAETNAKVSSGTAGSLATKAHGSGGLWLRRVMSSQLKNMYPNRF
jgi:hypothetical protein